jgi:hypothetical protein
MALFEEQPIQQPVPHMKEERKSYQESPFFLDEKWRHRNAPSYVLLQR